MISIRHYPLLWQDMDAWQPYLVNHQLREMENRAVCSTDVLRSPRSSLKLWNLIGDLCPLWCWLSLLLR